MKTSTMTLVKILYTLLYWNRFVVFWHKRGLNELIFNINRNLTTFKVRQARGVCCYIARLCLLKIAYTESGLTRVARQISFAVDFFKASAS